MAAHVPVTKESLHAQPTEIPSTTGARRCPLAGQGSHACGLKGLARIPILIRYPAGCDAPQGTFESVVGLLARTAAHRTRVALWRQRLAELLAERGDGLSDGQRLLVRTERWGPEAE